MGEYKYLSLNRLEMKKYVIYTVMVGGYEDVFQPLVVDDRFDFILFSNDFNDETIGVWQVRPIPTDVCDKNDNKRLSRYPKSHPETMLHEYEYSLYIDANLQIINEWIYARFIELVNNNVEFAGVQLVLIGRDCIYDHAYDMCNMRVVHDYDALKQLHELNQKGFPRHFGLNENNFIFRMHTERMKLVDEEWWMWIKNFTYRDQLSYMYCLWKYKVSLFYFLPQGMDTGNGTYIRRIEHNSRDRVSRTKFLQLGLLEECRRRCRTQRSQYLKDWHNIYQYRNPVLINVLWGFYHTILDAPYFLFKLIRLQRKRMDA